MASSRNRSFSSHLLATCVSCLEDHVVLPGHRLTVGLSGGIDSVCLLHALRQLGMGRKFEVSAVHVHHGLSCNADSWMTFCQELCEELSVHLTIAKVRVELPASDGLEAAARRSRYDVFQGQNCEWIVLAHHRGDQAETQLFNLFRGTGLAGAAAMAARKGRVLRPFLEVARREIEAYAHANELRWVDDESNRDTSFSRNFIRHEVLTRITSRFSAAEKNLAAAADRFREAVGLLDDLASEDLRGYPAQFPVAVVAVASLSESRARNVIRYLLVQAGVPIPSDARLREALRQVLSAGADRHPRVRFGPWDIVRKHGKIDIERVPKESI